MSGLRGLVALAGGALLLSGWLPAPDRIANAVANQNREAGRARTVELAVELRFEGDPEPAATGTLLSDPTGRARLELVSPRGFVERHLYQAGRVRAARDGVPLEDARTFLPPLWVLQTSSGAGLARWLAALGADAGQVDLGYDGDADCYVLGGRRPGPADAAPDAAAFWVEQVTLAPVRLDLSNGTRFRFGPALSFEDVTVPAWLEVQAPGEPPARLSVLGAVPKTVPSGGLDPAWLRGSPAAPPPSP